MRQILFLSGLFLSILYLTGCSGKDTELVSERSASLKITAGIDNQKLTSFLNNDAIGIYPVSYNGDTPGILGDISNPMNVKYTYDGKLWFPDPGKDILLNEVPMDMYAYYPYDETMSGSMDKLNLSAYPFDLSGNQQNTIKDFLWARIENISDVNHSAGLLFTHALTRYEIYLFFDQPQTGADVIIHNLKTFCEIDLRNGIATASGGNEKKIIPGPLAVNNEKTIFSYEAILPPQQVASGTPVFSISFQDKTVIYILPSDMDFKPQKSYVFNLIIGEVRESRSLSVIEKDF